MTLQDLLDVAVGAALIAWICWKQLTWRPVDIVRMLRLPAILAVVGVVMLGRTSIHALSVGDVALLAAELAVSAGTGVAMGALARFRPASDPAAAPGRGVRPLSGRGRLSGEPRRVTLETRTGWLGIALWAVLIVVRVGMDAVAGAAGSPLVSATGVILLVIAVNRATRVGVIAHRGARVPQRAAVA